MPDAPSRSNSKKKAQENSLLMMMNQRGDNATITSMNSQTWKANK